MFGERVDIDSESLCDDILLELFLGGFRIQSRNEIVHFLQDVDPFLIIPIL